MSTRNEIDKRAKEKLEKRKQEKLLIRKNTHKKASGYIKSAITILKNENMDLDIVQTLQSIYNNFKLQGK